MREAIRLGARLAERLPFSNLVEERIMPTDWRVSGLGQDG